MDKPHCCRPTRRIRDRALVTSEAFDEYVAHLFDADPVVRGLTRGILRTQRKLQNQVDEAAWRTYLRPEAMVNHRLDEILQKVFDRLGSSRQHLGRLRR